MLPEFDDPVCRIRCCLEASKRTVEEHLRCRRKGNTVTEGPHHTAAFSGPRAEKFRRGIPLAAVVWLVFLYPTVDSVVRGSDSAAMKAFGLVVVALFAGSYLWCWKLVDGNEKPKGNSASVGLGLLVGLCAISWLVIGADTQGLLFFLVAWTGFSFPPLVSLPVIAASSSLVAFGGPWGTTPPLAIGIAVLGFGMAQTRAYGSYITRESYAEKQLALRDQRDRVARDVHDTVGQKLTAVSVKLELADKLVTADPAAARAQIQQSRVLTRDALQEMRHVVAGLTTPDLDVEISATAALLNAAGVTTIISVSREMDRSSPDSPRLTAMGWIVREATTNILRHAGATKAVVEVTPDRLTVSDNGNGSVPAHPGGTGVVSMRQRAEATGGVFTLSSTPGAGTTITATWESKQQ